MDQICLFVFIFVLFTMQRQNIARTQTRGAKMEGTDESHELWWHPQDLIKFLLA